METRENLFNTPLESGIRSLIVLQAVSPRSCDVQRMVIYDYLLVHSGDVENGPISLHPPSPLRTGELLVRRALVEQGLELLFHKGLAEKQYLPSAGIVYRASRLAVPFLEYFESTYAQRARRIATWLAGEFGNVDDKTLREFTDRNLGKWGAEFVGDPLLEERLGE